MKKIKSILLAVALWATSVQAFGQTESKAFCKNLYNKEFDVFLNINTKDYMSVPAHELFGNLPGYIGLTTSTFYWLILEAEVEGKTVKMQLVNDYGSEDLTAELKQTSDSTFVLTQGTGSAIKLPKNKKWLKLPKKITFIGR